MGLSPAILGYEWGSFRAAESTKFLAPQHVSLRVQDRPGAPFMYFQGSSRGIYLSGCQGLISRMPVPLKSFWLRVASKNRCFDVIAAIAQSAKSIA